MRKRKGYLVEIHSNRQGKILVRLYLIIINQHLIFGIIGYCKQLLSS